MEICPHKPEAFLIYLMALEHLVKAERPRATAVTTDASWSGLLVLVSTRVIGGNDSKKKQARRLTGAPDFLYPAQWVRQLKPLHRIVGPLVEV